jgi:oligopeptide transport system substrate-binding protein
MRGRSRSTRLLCAITLPLTLSACTLTSADSPFFGTTNPPKDDVLRYVTGPEPESLDPHIGSGQPEARIYIALYQGLVEYHPKTMLPIPAIAESWDTNKDSSVFTFHLRKNARFSNGDPITAHDFVWSLRRALAPELASRLSYMAYPVRYAQGFNEGSSFVRDLATGEFEMDKASGFRRVVPASEVKPVPGKEFVPIRAEDIGIEALDDHTLRYTLSQPSPYFVGMMAHQFFMVVHRKTIEQYGTEWTQPENIVSSGPFKLKEWVPYDRVVVERDPMYWNAASVRLKEIRFYPTDDNTTTMNLYKAGVIDAMQNHSVPMAWLDLIQPLKDYMDAPELANSFIQINTTKPPMNDLRVRKAFGFAIDREALAKYRRVAKPLYAFVPTGIFPGYPQPPGDGFDPKRARELLTEAGYRDSSGNYDPTKFPIDQVEYTYNTSDVNRQIAEFLQAQWKQNLQLTVPLRNMEFKTFLSTRANLEYKGMSRSGWIGDYMDPFSYLNLFSTPRGDNGTGWWDPRYVALLNSANRILDPQERYQKLAEAEKMLLDIGAVIPLLVNATDWMKKPYVKGMYPNPGTLHAWDYVYIERDPSKWDYAQPDLKP